MLHMQRYALSVNIYHITCDKFLKYVCAHEKCKHFQACAHPKLGWWHVLSSPQPTRLSFIEFKREAKARDWQLPGWGSSATNLSTGLPLSSASQSWRVGRLGSAPERATSAPAVSYTVLIPS